MINLLFVVTVFKKSLLIPEAGAAQPGLSLSGVRVLGRWREASKKINFGKQDEDDDAVGSALVFALADAQRRKPESEIVTISFSAKSRSSTDENFQSCSFSQGCHRLFAELISAKAKSSGPCGYVPQNSSAVWPRRSQSTISSSTCSPTSTQGSFLSCQFSSWVQAPVSQN